ncbi:filamentous hemagglutinin outer membrane protein [Pandoraea horticolens]|uniref:Filamentous hemagglutinin outer membrane protein n=1 Tax=Pandoraea horticolens TaxID=2508298 RepID=A0A5E4XRP4_9BURK|nr:hemagglutinin repeat-containing protein [Pandoraea horticolens]VVE39037.1 filamentous hemagglutinin outer membrane protein [Pandoraea horticolens]
MVSIWGAMSHVHFVRRHDSKKWQHDSSSGFLSKMGETSASNSHQTIAVGSTVSGNAVGVAAGRDLVVSGSTVVGTQDVALQAGRDLRIESAQNENESSASYEKKRSGLGSSGGVGVSYGKNEQRDWTPRQWRDADGQPER